VPAIPARITHRALDWMFPVEMARDLSHIYPRELNAQIIAWLRDS
jgi:hypothetical protein